ncbi:hypothetical protein BCAH1134_C0765 (plasmid) [Bacillus cereus AH1134]|nr:hypothetical protein BCAH1134_C0765 [Bacillus cereus AH1134]
MTFQKRLLKKPNQNSKKQIKNHQFFQHKNSRKTYTHYI